MSIPIRTARALTAAAIALWALGGCASNGGTTPVVGQTSSGSAAGSPHSSASPLMASSARDGANGDVPSLPAELDGVTMVATEVTGAHTIAPGSQISVTLTSDGTISAYAGCNEMGGSYTLAGNVLTAPRLGQTVMACVDQQVAAQDSPPTGLLMDQEVWFSNFLTSSPRWTFENGTLTLTDGTDTITLTKAPSGAAASSRSASAVAPASPTS